MSGAPDPRDGGSTASLEQHRKLPAEASKDIVRRGFRLVDLPGQGDARLVRYRVDESAIWTWIARKQLELVAEERRALAARRVAEREKRDKQRARERAARDAAASREAGGRESPKAQAQDTEDAFWTSLEEPRTLAEKRSDDRRANAERAEDEALERAEQEAHEWLRGAESQRLAADRWVQEKGDELASRPPPGTPRERERIHVVNPLRFTRE